MTGWDYRPLSSVCEIDKSQGIHKDLPYVGMEDMESHTGRFLGSLEPQAVKSSTFKFDDEHVLYGRLRPYLNKVLVPDFSGHCSTEVFPLKPAPELDRGFLFHWLTMSGTVDQINRTCTGARMPRANMKEVMTFPIPLPPLPEQKRIVAILDEAFAGIDAAVANTEKNLASARELFESYLNAVFTQKGDGWVESSLGKSCEFFNGKAHEKQIDEKGKYIVANSKFISSNGTSFKKTNNALCPLAIDDIVMVMSDVPKGKALAKCFLIDKADLYSLNQRICCIRSDKFDKQFLFFHLSRHPYLLSFDNKENQTNLRKGDILKCPLWIPDLEEQKLVASKLADYKNYTDRLEAIYQQKLSALAELKQSILQKAFAGELTALPEKEFEEAVAQ